MQNFNIHKPLNTGDQTFRLSRGIPELNNKGNLIFIPHPQWWETGPCRDAGCSHYELGWETTIDPSTTQGQWMLDGIRQPPVSKMSFTQAKGEDGLLHFHFEAGQKCFRKHSVPVQRDAMLSNFTPGNAPSLIDPDEFFTTFNEVSERRKQHRRQV